MRSQSFNEFVDLTFHDKVKLMNGQANAVICDAILFEVVSADLFGAVSAPDHRLSLGRQEHRAAFAPLAPAGGPEDPHCFFAILYLRFLILHRNDNTGGQVCKPNC